MLQHALLIIHPSRLEIRLRLCSTVSTIVPVFLYSITSPVIFYREKPSIKFLAESPLVLLGCARPHWPSALTHTHGVRKVLFPLKLAKGSSSVARVWGWRFSHRRRGRGVAGGDLADLGRNRFTLFRKAGVMRIFQRECTAENSS